VKSQCSSRYRLLEMLHSMMNLISRRNMFRWHVNFLPITLEGIIQLVREISVSNFEKTFMLAKNQNLSVPTGCPTRFS